MRRGGAQARQTPDAHSSIEIKQLISAWSAREEPRRTIDTFTGRWMNNERFGNCVTGSAEPRNEVVYSPQPALLRKHFVTFCNDFNPQTVTRGKFHDKS